MGYNLSAFNIKLFVCFVFIGTTAVYAQPVLYPALNKGEEIIHHKGFSLVYSEPNEQARWVAYVLTAAETEKAFERSDDFKPDPSIKSGSATNADYSKSGYDRGHLAPAADMSWSAESMQASFYFSNMSPQEPSFNRGIWKKLEEKVRDWAVEYDSLYIVTGPLFMVNKGAIGANNVTVPGFYYKVLLDLNKSNSKAIGFILPNAASSAPLNYFAVSVDSVEKLSGINFFQALPDADENKLEASYCSTCWNWGASKSQKPSVACSHKGCTNQSSSATGFCPQHREEKVDTPAKAEPQATTVQCNGTTKAGQRCKRKTDNANGRCYQHQ
jgi:endonuclease G